MNSNFNFKIRSNKSRENKKDRYKKYKEYNILYSLVYYLAYFK